MQITPPTRSALLQEPRVSIPPASLLGHLAEQGRAEAGGWRCWPGSSRMPPQAVPGPLPCLGAGRRELSTVGLVPSRKGTKSTRFPRATSASAARSVSTSGGAVLAAPWPSAVIAATPRDRSLPGRLHLLPGPKGRFPQSDSHRPPPPSSGHMVLVGAEPRSPQPIAAPPSQPVPETEDPGGCGTRPVWRRHRLRLPHGCRAAPELLALPGAAWAGRCPREVQVRLRVLATQQCHRATAAPMERAPHPHSPFPGAGLGSPALSRDPHAPLWCAPAGDKRALASPSPLQGRSGTHRTLGRTAAWLRLRRATFTSYLTPECVAPRRERWGSFLGRAGGAGRTAPLMSQGVLEPGLATRQATES